MRGEHRCASSFLPCVHGMLPVRVRRLFGGNIRRAVLAVREELVGVLLNLRHRNREPEVVQQEEVQFELVKLVHGQAADLWSDYARF